ncbi:hypothetical protein TRICI_000865 [Trichomonascus ciferrii]|uniref:Uncharacterized protein n=1 Tax=Trichomonascus ciferrii TaxID=44093 RepID=A0A642VBG2_9ASCO|nr:hypothetical protein TRICI_000865 [Trichomonascus ciferrii]
MSIAKKVCYWPRAPMYRLKPVGELYVEVADKYSNLVGPWNLVKLFEDFKTSEGLHYYLQSIVNLSNDPDVVFKYIQAAAQIGQFTEIEHIARDNNVYNPEKVKNFLKDAKLADQLPLIIVCNSVQFLFVEASQSHGGAGGWPPANPNPVVFFWGGVFSTDLRLPRTGIIALSRNGVRILTVHAASNNPIH